ncbi:MAG: hypothetical protein AAFV53_16085 [Myxococcota bacterium]
MRATTILAGLLTVGGCDAAASPDIRPMNRAQAPDGFWDHWGDGNAEVSGYTLTQPRYGQQRPGEVVMVFVTETFTHRQRVKSDGGHRDTYPIIKLNEARDFQTGVYDYNVMTSAFVPLDGSLPQGVPTKVSFSMQEWCGMTFAELTAAYTPGTDPTTFNLHGSSYFDGESKTDRSVDIPPGGVTADALPVYVRGLAGEWLKPGEQRTIGYLPRLMDSRMQHRPMAWTTATARRSETPSEITVPAGTFTIETITVDPDGFGETRWMVETEPPHRIIAWTGPGGERAELTGSYRGPYWQQHGRGQETIRQRLGLPRPHWVQ